MSSNKTAFKILTADQWADWQRAGAFSGASIDFNDGFIHLSTAEQARQTYTKYFAGQRDLAVAEVDLKQLGDAIRWEESPSRPGTLFPHVYGTSIPTSAVLRHWTEVDAALMERLEKGTEGI